MDPKQKTIYGFFKRTGETTSLQDSAQEKLARADVKKKRKTPLGAREKQNNSYQLPTYFRATNNSTTERNKENEMDEGVGSIAIGDQSQENTNSGTFLCTQQSEGLLTPENFCTPDNRGEQTPRSKPPTLKRIRRTMLSPVAEMDESSDNENEWEEARPNKRRRMQFHQLPSYFDPDFQKNDWEEKVLRSLVPSIPWDRHFHRGKRLGCGDYSEVYEAADPSSGGRFAIKTSKDFTFWRNRVVYVKEAQAHALVSGHPHIVEFYDSWFLPQRDNFDEQHLISMELCGRSLKSISMEIGSFQESRLRSILRQISSALDHMHTLGVVHMDVKPDNILVCSGKYGMDTYKLGDFGMATRVDGQGEHDRGTTRYMDAHHDDWRPHSERIDVFSLGATICELGLGMQVAEDEGTSQEQTWRDSLPSHFSHNFKSLLQDMLMPNPEDRPSAKDVLKRA